MQHIKNTNPEMWILYRMKEFYRGDFSDFLPSLVINSYTVTADLEKHSSSLRLNLHTKKVTSAQNKIGT